MNRPLHASHCSQAFPRFVYFSMLDYTGTTPARPPTLFLVGDGEDRKPRPARLGNPYPSVRAPDIACSVAQPGRLCLSPCAALFGIELTRGWHGWASAFGCEVDRLLATHCCRRRFSHRATGLVKGCGIPARRTHTRGVRGPDYAGKRQACTVGFSYSSSRAALGTKLPSHCSL